MTTSSCKSKGRKLQQIVRDGLMEIGKGYGLETGDVVSTGMGQTGVDVQLSPAAKRVFGDLHVECKNVENLNVTGVFFQHLAKYPNSPLAMLVHKRNNTVPLVTIKLVDFLSILGYMVERLNA